jgi:hypothetical protein
VTGEAVEGVERMKAGVGLVVDWRSSPSWRVRPSSEVLELREEACEGSTRRASSVVARPVVRGGE